MPSFNLGLLHLVVSRPKIKDPSQLLKRFITNMSATKSPAAQRINFGKVELLAETPDLLGIQIQSFKDFFQLETTPDKRNNGRLVPCV